MTKIIIKVKESQTGPSGKGKGYGNGIVFCAKCKLVFSCPPFATFYLCPYCGTPLRHKPKNRKRGKK